MGRTNRRPLEETDMDGFKSMFRPTSGRASNRDTLGGLRDSLRKASGDSSFNEDEKQNALAALDDLDSGGNPFRDRSPKSVIEDGEDGGGGFWSGVGSVLDPVFDTFESVGSVFTSGLNVALGDIRNRHDEDYDFGARANEQGNFFQRYFAGLSIPEFLGGEFSVGGLDVGNDSVDVMGSEAFLRDDDLSWGGDLRLPDFLGGYNMPDLNSMAKFGIDMAFDPLNFLGAPGVKAVGSLTRRGKALEKGRTTMRISRQSRSEDISNFVKNYRELPEAAKGSGDWGENALKALREGGVPTAVKQARAKSHGFTLRNLEDAGVGTKIAFAGREVPGTGALVASKGGFKTGVRTTKEARQAKEGRAISKAVSNIPERLGRMMDGLATSNVTRAVNKLVGDGNMGETDIVKQREYFRAAGNMANEALPVAATDYTRAVLSRSKMIRGAVGAKSTRKAENRALNDLTGKAIESLDDVAGSAKGLDAALSAVISFSQKNDWKVSDLTIDNVVKIVDSPTVATADALLVPTIVQGLMELDPIALRWMEKGEGVTSFRPSELAGPNGSLKRNAGTSRQWWNNIAVMKTHDLYEMTGSAQLGDAMYAALRNPKAVVAHFDGVPGSAGALLPDLRNMDPQSVSKAFEAAGKAMKNTTTPNGLEMPVEFVQQLMLSMDIGPLARANVEQMALSLSRTSEVGLKHIEALRKFRDGLSKQDGMGFRMTNKGNNSQGAKDLNDIANSGGRNALKAAKQKRSNITPKQAQKIKKAGGKEAVQREVRRRVREGWYNPDLLRADETFPMFDSNNRAFLAKAQQRYGVDLIEEELKELETWFTGWMDAVPEQFRKFDEKLSPEMAATAKAIETHFHNANVKILMYGGEAVDALNSAVSKGGAELLTREDWHELARGVVNLRVTDGIADSFGSRSWRGGVDKSEDVLGEGSLLTRQQGVALDGSALTTDYWAGAMLETSRFLNGMKRAKVGNELGQKSLDFLSKTMRPFKSQATALPGFHVRNLRGAMMMNFFAGVRHSGVGGYREFGPLYDISRRAMRDEAVNFAPSGSSPIWDEIGKRKGKFVHTDDTEKMKKIAYSGQLTTSQSGGDLLDQKFAYDEVQLGDSKLDKGLQRATLVGDRISAVTEGGVASLARKATTGLKSGDGVRGKVDDGLAGLADSTRESIETLMRGSLMWSSMKKDGYGFDAALERVATTHFDYWDMTNAGKIADAMMPFYLFRARMTQTSMNMMMATPGMGAQMERVGGFNKDVDPFGPDQGSYTMGAGSMKGLDFFGKVEDPRTAAFEDPVTLIDNLLEGDAGGAWRELIAENFGPLIGFGYKTATGTLSFDGDPVIERHENVQYQDGLIPRLAETFGWADEKVAAITGVVGSDHPFVSLLKVTGNVQIVGDNVYMTRNGADLISDWIPFLGAAEALALKSPLFKGEIDPDNKMTEEEYGMQISRKVWNRVFSATGVPATLVDESQRVRVMKNAKFDLDQYLRQRGGGAVAEDHAGDSFLQSMEMYSERLKLAMSSSDA